MAKIEKAKNQAGQTIFPVTVSDAVLMGNGKTLKGELSELGSENNPIFEMLKLSIEEIDSLEKIPTCILDMAVDTNFVDRQMYIKRAGAYNDNGTTKFAIYIEDSNGFSCLYGTETVDSYSGVIEFSNKEYGVYARIDAKIALEKEYSDALYNYENKLPLDNLSLKNRNWSKSFILAKQTKEESIFESFSPTLPNLSSADDANAFLANGSVLCINTMNMPTNGTFILSNISADITKQQKNRWSLQLAAKDSGELYKRFYYNGSFTAWIKIVDFGVLFNRSYLADKFLGNESIKSDGDCNSALKDGVSFVQNGAKNNPINANGILLTTNTTFNNTDAVFQLLVSADSNNAEDLWHRTKFGSYDFSEWKNSNMPPLKYNVNGSIPNGGDCNNALEDGRYIAVAGSLNTPLENKTFTLTVRRYYTTNEPNKNSIYWLTQFATTADGDLRTFMRKKYSSNEFSEWVELTNPDSIGHKLSGKTIAFFGDSITEIGDYPERIAAKTGALAYKCGFGGCRYSTYGESQINGYSQMCMSYISDCIKSGDFSPLLNAAENVKGIYDDDNLVAANTVADIDYEKLDYLVLFWGTNDYGGNMPIGDKDDMSHDTLCGGINRTISNILSKYPNIHIVIFTPYWRATYPGISDFCDSDIYTNPLGLKLPEYVEAIVERAKYWHIPVINLYDSMGINKLNYQQWLSDGLHPKNGIGFEFVAQKVLSGLESVC